MRGQGYQAPPPLPRSPFFVPPTRAGERDGGNGEVGWVMDWIGETGIGGWGGKGGDTERRGEVRGKNIVT